MLKILIAYDGSECSEKALRDLRKAGMPEEAEALVLTVADRWLEQLSMIDNSLSFPIPWEEPRDLMQLSLSDARMNAMLASETLQGYFPGWEVRHEVVIESAGRGVMDKIESWRPDLVIMGSHGRSAVGRLLFGSVSQNVLTHVHCNLRISRGCDEKDEKQVPPLRVVVAYDGSQESETAFEAALCRHWPKGTAIRLVTVMDMRVSLAFLRPTGPIRYWMKEGEKDPQAWIGRMLADQKKRIEEKGLIAYSEALPGDPKHVLLREAQKWGADMIFAGSRGLSGRDRIIAGSVSTALAMHAHCSVEIVHRAWNAVFCCGKGYEEHRDCMTREFNREAKK